MNIGTQDEKQTAPATTRVVRVPLAERRLIQKRLPHDSFVLSVGLFEGKPTMWLQVPADAWVTGDSKTWPYREFCVLQDGDVIPAGARFLGTIFRDLRDSFGQPVTLVWHAFEGGD